MSLLINILAVIGGLVVAGFLFLAAGLTLIHLMAKLQRRRALRGR